MSCADCGEVIRVGDLTQCPKCGSHRLALSVRETVAPPLVSVFFEATDPSRTGGKKKRMRIWGHVRWEPSHMLGGALVRVRQLFDKEADRYIHEVVTKDGEVLHHQDHRLKDHQGHGSAKAAKPMDAPPDSIAPDAPED